MICLSHFRQDTLNDFCKTIDSDLVGFLVADQLALAHLHPALNFRIFIEELSISRL